MNQEEIQQAIRDNESEAGRVTRWLEMSLADVGLSVRTVNTLDKQQILTVGQLVSKTREQLLSLSNFGEQSIVECRQLMKQLEIDTPNWNKPSRKKRRRK